MAKPADYQCKRHWRCELHPWAWDILWRSARQPAPAFLPGESYVERSLVGYSPWSHRVGHDWSDLAHTHTVQNRSGWEFLFCFKRRTQPAKTPQYSEIPQRRPGIQLMPDLHVYPESLSLTQLCESPGSMGFPRREHTGAGCHFSFRGIFPTQGSNSHLLCLLN